MFFKETGQLHTITWSITKEITLGPDGTYYVILDNTYSSITGKSVHIIIDYTSRDESFLFQGLIIVVVGGGVIGFIYLIRKRQPRRDFYQPPVAPPTQQTPISPIQQSSSRFCPSCGTAIEHGGKFCIKCGQDIP